MGHFLLLNVEILELLIFFSQISTCILPFEKSQLNPTPSQGGKRLIKFSKARGIIQMSF